MVLFFVHIVEYSKYWMTGTKVEKLKVCRFIKFDDLLLRKIMKKQRKVSALVFYFNFTRGWNHLNQIVGLDLQE